LLDEEWNVVRIYGDVSPYMAAAPIEVGRKFGRALRAELFPEFSRVFHLVRGSEVTVQSGAITAPWQGKHVNAVMTITPIAIGPADRQYLLLFEESQTGAVKIAAAEDDLDASKRYLEAVIEEHLATTEELRNANEQLQRSNEELQSANEELIATAAELQAANQELGCLNDELANRNTEISRHLIDLDFLLNSLQLAVAFVGTDLTLRRLTAQAEKTFHLSPADVGRRISDFNWNIDVPELESLVREVLDRLAPLRHEVRTGEGRAYSLWIRPYLSAGRKIEGAAIMLLENVPAPGPRKSTVALSPPSRR
jgi:two-component system CheB/CheR fusion protein